jgi:hypothetical protein
MLGFKRVLLAACALVAVLPATAATARPAPLLRPRCDSLDPKACLLPFPNDLFTVADRSTHTGRRVDFSLLAMPRNTSGKPIDPTEWNRNDGFSPNSPVLTYVPGLDLHATWKSKQDSIANLAWSLRADAPIVVLDATTGKRYPFWSELDEHAGTTDADRLLILHPAVQFVEGHRYVVALRDLRRSDGSIIPAGPTFAAYRDGTDPPGLGRRAFGARLPHMEKVFRELARAGVGRDNLFLTWDFTVASRQNLTERALRIRNQAFAALGDTNLADNRVSGRPPAFKVTKVEDMPTGATMRHVEGTITVPNFLTPQVEVAAGSTGATLNDTINGLPQDVKDALKPVTGAVPIGADDILTNALAVPDSRFYTAGSRDHMPRVDPLQPTVDVPFVCNIARGSDVSPSHPILYGHGLLGSRTEANGGSTQRLRERGFSPCAVDWWGLSISDLPQVGMSLVDFSNFPGLVDRMQQGFLNFMLLGRALANAGGLSTNPAFRNAKGKPLLRTNELYYDGNSQGSIMGGALTALDPDFRRSVLGVAGMGYSTLLNRSVDWEGKYAVVYQAAYPNEVDRQLGYALIQMMWDRGEAAGYAQQMSVTPLPGTPSHDVMLQIAFGDHQVANITAEVEARTISAAMKLPPLAPHQHWATDPTFGLRTVTGNASHVGSVLVYWFAAGTGLATPPNANIPDGAGKDPHGTPRSYGPATDQVVRFLLTGDLIDVCHGGPCVVPPS